MTKEHVPTEDLRALVNQMSAVGIPQISIALVIEMDVKTLRLHYRKELDTAAIKANAKIGGTLYNKAMAGDTTAAIWWSKTRMGWSDKVEISGPDGGAIPLSININLIDP